MKKNVMEISQVVEDFISYMRQNKYYGADIVDYDFGFSNKPFSMVFEISWGDWKHDHLWFKELVYEFFMNSDIKIDMVITEENGSDAYSAEYKIRVNKF